MMRYLPRLACALLIGAGFAGCSSDSSNGSGPRLGTVRMHMTDAPADVDAISLVVREVAVRQAGSDTVSGWEVVSAESLGVSLLDLQNGVLLPIGERRVPVGTYDQVRLILGEGSTITVDGVTHPLVVPSGSTSGLKLNGTFDVSQNQVVELVIDWDARRSVHQTGNDTWMLRPVVRFFVAATTGRITGTISPTNAPVTAYAISGSDTLQSTASSVTTGQFVLAGLSTGTYSVALDAGTGWRDTTLNNVSVTAGGTSSLGTITLTAE